MRRGSPAKIDVPSLLIYEIFKVSKFGDGSMKTVVAYVDAAALWVATHPKTSIGVFAAVALVLAVL